MKEWSMDKCLRKIDRLYADTQLPATVRWSLQRKKTLNGWGFVVFFKREVGKERSSSFSVNGSCHTGCTETIVDIDYCQAGGATVEHAE